MDFIIKTLTKLGIGKHDLDYRFIRASMVIIFLFFGYSKWFEYEAQGLIQYISHGPLIFWLYPVFGIRGAGRFLGVSEWTFGSLLLLGFWNKKLGILGAIGSCFAFLSTITIIPFLPNAWATSAGGFPAMTDSVAFLMKDFVLLAASVYLLRQDVIRIAVATEHLSVPSERVNVLRVRRWLLMENKRSIFDHNCSHCRGVRDAVPRGLSGDGSGGDKLAGISLSNSRLL
jgi:uncharacterized membrane protein YkgB